MANEIITTLHPDQDPDTNLYPNIKKDNIPNGSIDRNKLDGGINDLLNSINELHPSGTGTSAQILAFTEDKGIYVGTDTHHWYYWDGTQYVDGGVYQAMDVPDGVALKAYGLASSTILSGFEDLNTLPRNSIYAYTNSSALPLHAPVQNGGTIITINPKYNNTVGTVQIYATSTQRFFIRNSFNGTTWSSWIELRNTSLSSFGQDSSGSLPSDFSDLNSVPKNCIYLYAFHIPTNAPVNNGGTIISFNSNIGNMNGTMQIYATSTLRFFIRYTFNGTTWSSWTEITNDKNDYLSCYLKIGCIGDSLASGESVSNQGGVNSFHDQYEFSWGQYIARDLGIDVINFSKGGLTTRSWLSDTNVGLAKALIPDNLCKCYIIGLGVNDVNDLGLSYLGSMDDVGDTIEECGNTFYGNYAKIILHMKTIQPKAHFFVLTMPTTNSTALQFNQAIRDLASHFSNVFLIDIESDSFFTTGALNNYYKRVGHYSAMGYRLISTHLQELISNYIKNNPSYFTQIEYIGTDWQYNY